MARVGRGLPVIMRYSVNLASKACPDSQADEQENQNLTRFATHH